MKIRERIANWLTGGEYQLRQEIRDMNYNHMLDAWKLSGEYDGALEQIAAQETATANATVKRMARIAREALA